MPCWQNDSESAECKWETAHLSEWSPMSASKRKDGEVGRGDRLRDLWWDCGHVSRDSRCLDSDQTAAARLASGARTATHATLRHARARPGPAVRESNARNTAARGRQLHAPTARHREMI